LLVFTIIGYTVCNEFIRKPSVKENSKGQSNLLNFLNIIFCIDVFYSLIGLSLLYYQSYETWINIVIVSISYGMSSVLIIWLALIFFSWYKSSHDRVVFLYFVSMSLIAFNLILTALFVDFKLTGAQYSVREFVGGGMDASRGKNPLLGDLYNISSLISFFSIWMTTAILMNSYREKLIGSVKYWIILVLPLVYFLMTYFYQFFLSNMLS
jgi:hypothetical protein